MTVFNQYLLTDAEDVEVKEKLGEIIRKLGPYSRDHLTHAENVINSNSEKAQAILKILEEARYR